MSAAEARPEPATWFFRSSVEVSAGRLLVLLLIATAGAALDLRAGIGPHDEGLMLQWGHRIASGEWPYRDFWCNYLPGQPLLQALLGPSLVTWRIVRAVTGGLAAVLAYLLVRRETVDDRWALGAWAGVAAAMAWPLTPGPNASATVLALAALLAARRHGAIAGTLAGLAFLFRPELGAAAAIAAAILGRREHLALVRERGRLQRETRRVTAAPLVMAAVVAVAGLLPFLIVAPVDLLSQTFGFVEVQHLQRLPFPLAPHTSDPNKVLERMFPAVLVAWTLIWAAATLPRRRGWALVPLMLAGLAYLLARTDEFHLVPLAVVLSVGLAVAAAQERRMWLRVLLAAGLALVVLHGADRQFGHLRDAADDEALDLAHAGGVRTDPDDAPALRSLAAAVSRRSRPGDPILSAPPRYDRVRVGDTLLYTLLDRTDPTRYDVVQPGVVTTALVQREMIAALRRSHTRLVVRWLDPQAAATEPNGSARSSGVHLLDDFIGARYRRVARYGPYLLLERRPRS